MTTITAPAPIRPVTIDWTRLTPSNEEVENRFVSIAGSSVPELAPPPRRPPLWVRGLLSLTSFAEVSALKQAIARSTIIAVKKSWTI
eukprot:1231229-Prymnesium_polylepis.2